jgi:hypothetical protein
MREAVNDYTPLNAATMQATTAQIVEETPEEIIADSGALLYQETTKEGDEIKTYSRNIDESENIKPSSISGRKTEEDPFAGLKARENKVLEETRKQYREDQEQKKAEKEKVTEEKTSNMDDVD